MNLALWIVLFLAVDAIVVFFVFRRARRARGTLALAVTGIEKIARFSKDMHQEAGRYLQANYSGDPGHLPHALQGLMGVARARAAEEGLTFDDAVLRKLIEASAIKHRVAKAAEIRTALDQAA